MASGKDKTAKRPLAPEIADRLLQLLSTDTAFRRAFKRDPAAALAALGHAPGPDEPCCDPVDRIASKREFAIAREMLRAHLTAYGAMMVPHCFEAGKLLRALVRKP